MPHTDNPTSSPATSPTHTVEYLVHGASPIPCVATERVGLNFKLYVVAYVADPSVGWASQQQQLCAPERGGPKAAARPTWKEICICN